MTKHRYKPSRGGGDTPRFRRLCIIITLYTHLQNTFNIFGYLFFANAEDYVL